MTERSYRWNKYSNNRNKTNDKGLEWSLTNRNPEIVKLFSVFVSNHTRLPFLAKIDPSHTMINSFQVAFLLRKCDNVIEISLQNCKNVTDHVFKHIYMEATISGEVPELAHSIEKVDLSYTSCSSPVIFFVW